MLGKFHMYMCNLGKFHTYMCKQVIFYVYFGVIKHWIK